MNLIIYFHIKIKILHSRGCILIQGLLNGELLFDWIAVKMPWSRLEKFALGVEEEVR